VNLVPRGEICSLRGMFTPSFTPRGKHSLLFKRMKGRTENINPRGKLYSQGTKFTPGGQLRPWRSKFSPRGEDKNGPLIPMSTFEMFAFEMSGRGPEVVFGPLIVSYPISLLAIFLTGTFFSVRKNEQLQREHVDTVY
jgi:hypothetical protein